MLFVFFLTIGRFKLRVNVKYRKYMTKRFREYLTELEKYPLSEQKERLYKEFQTWKGEREQVDDVLVFGIKV